MVDHSEKNSSHCAAWSRGELWLEARQGLASWGGVAGWSGFGIGAGWGWGVEQRGWGGGGGGRGGRYSAHNKWQFSVWSGWLPSTGPLDCRGLLRGLWGEAEEEDERKQEGWHRFKES